MAHRLDVLMRSRELTNKQLAKKLRCSPNYISGIRNGQTTPGMKLAVALCQFFIGELTLGDLGIEIDPALVAAPSNDNGEEAP